MSLESAIKIFTEQGVSEPQKDVEIIQKAESLADIKQIMIEEGTDLGATQFVSFRISSLYKGDQEFADKTLERGLKRFRDYGFPEEIVAWYISRGGGVDVEMGLSFQMELGKLPKVQDRYKLRDFIKDADEYLFQTLKAYVTDS